LNLRVIAVSVSTGLRLMLILSFASAQGGMSAEERAGFIRNAYDRITSGEVKDFDECRKLIEMSKEHIAQLTSDALSRSVWEAKAYDMRAHITHTRKLLEAHAGIEQELLFSLRERLRREEEV